MEPKRSQMVDWVPNRIPVAVATVPKRDRQTVRVKGHCHHLVVLPVSEEVNRSVSSGLDDGPAPAVYPLLTPHLHGPLDFIWFDEVHAAGGVAGVLGGEAVSERA